MSRWGWLAGAAAVGALLLAWAFPRLDRSALDWGFEQDRDGFIALAQRTARAAGADTTGWRHYVQGSFDRRWADYRKQRPQSPLAATLRPVLVRVFARAPGGREWISTTFLSSGKWIAYEHGGAGGREGDGQTRAIAAFQAMSGSSAAQFQAVQQGVPAENGARSYSWEWVSEEHRFLVRMQAEVKGGRLVRATWTPDLAAVEESPSRQKAVSADLALTGILQAYLWLGIPLVCTVFFRSLVRRRAQLRFAGGFSFYLLASFVATYLTGAAVDSAVFVAKEGKTAVSVSLASSLLVDVMIWVFWFMVLAAGYESLTPAWNRAWDGARWAARWRAPKEVWRGVAEGLMLSLPLTALPFAFMAAAPELWPADSLVSVGRVLLPYPWVGPLRSLISSWHIFALAAAGVPLAWRYVKWPWLRVALLLGVSSALHGLLNDPTDAALGPTLVLGMFTTLAWYACLHWGGLLTLTAAVVGSAAVAQAATLLVQPAAAMQGAGLALAVQTGLVFLAALAGLRWGREGRTEDLAPLDLEREAQLKTEREYLLGDFAFARKAQEGMLPAEMPSIPGFSIAARCRPAREVGGDLFDFLALPDGRWLVCVADVSGKGVQAALFMTFTKGLLAAAARHHTRLADLAAVLNRHWCRTAQRRMFVTAVLAAVDPAKREVEILRAGHNPPLLLLPDGSRWLKPKGLALGLSDRAAYQSRVETEVVTVPPGAKLVLYSDGLPEAMNPERALFGEDRMLEVCRAKLNAGAGELVEGLLTGVQKFESGADAHDDLTLVVLEAR